MHDTAHRGMAVVACMHETLRTEADACSVEIWMSSALMPCSAACSSSSSSSLLGTFTALHMGSHM